MYTDEEHAVWHDLIEAQMTAVRDRACVEYLAGLDRLDLPRDSIPQCREISRRLLSDTGWRIAPVAALISFDTFFEMLNQKVFPAASFIRSRRQMAYLQEPDIFHEIFGHAPLLTNPTFAAFTHRIGEIGHRADSRYHAWLARLYWMTVEFGLIESEAGLRVYGAGLVSSQSEIDYALTSSVPERKPMELLEALRTRYRIDQFQSIYFVIDGFEQLFDLLECDLIERIDVARNLGLRDASCVSCEPSKSDQANGSATDHR